MTDTTAPIAGELAQVLRRFVDGAEETARLEAYQAGRAAMVEGRSLLDVVSEHHEALAAALRDGPASEQAATWVEASAQLVAESIGPFEMALRGFQEANETLVRVNGELKEQVAERRRAEDEARVSREAALRANAAKSEFLSRMSHELRTPLNAILGFAQILEMDQMDPDQAECIGQILKGGRHLLDLINEVLDIARIESGRISLSPEPVAVDESLHDVLDLVRPISEGRGIVIRSEFRPGSDVFVVADRQRLRQVLLNLLSNAVKYNRDEGSVRVRCAQTGLGTLRIEVEDEGLGIDPDKLGRLFVPFDRLDMEQTGVEGTGLGLALSKRLVEAMGGVLSVESVVGTGSTFAVELPLAESPEALADLGAADADALRVRETRPPVTVLYIEDNPSNLRLLERVFANRPEVKLISATMGRLGLELARAHRPELILLDLHLPDIPGADVLRSLREDPVTAQIPVVVVSADATSGQKARLLNAGALAYLTKPIDVKELLSEVDLALEDRADRAG